jgi:hypothetical protein
MEGEKRERGNGKWKWESAKTGKGKWEWSASTEAARDLWRNDACGESASSTRTLISEKEKTGTTDYADFADDSVRHRSTICVIGVICGSCFLW